MSIQNIWYNLRTNVIPASIIFIFPTIIHSLSKVGHLQEVNMTWSEIFWGNTTTWKISLILISWIYFCLIIPSEKLYGPMTASGLKPCYQNNGWSYYVVSNLIFFITCSIYPSIPEIVYMNVPHLLSTLNIIALVLSGYLWWKGRNYPEEKINLDKCPLLFEFYRGMERHPRLFGVDVKQLVNCRIGLTSWQLLVYCYWFFSYEKFGFNWGFTANVGIQTMYIAKFFWDENLYFNSLDANLDCQGFYLCWGSLVFVPGAFVFNSYYFVANPSNFSKSAAIITLFLGAISILVTYLIDLEKVIFRNTNGKRSLWSNNPKVIKAEYETVDGKQESTLLASGFWGKARHMNYFFENSVYYLWSLPGYHFGIWFFFCPIILSVLIIHRLYRDDDKCSKKYGAAWQEYCKVVKYKMIPYVF